MASARLVETGLRWYKEHRVTEVERDGDALWGLVEDPEREEPLTVELSRAGGKLSAGCGCGSPDGPARGSGKSPVDNGNKR